MKKTLAVLIICGLMLSGCGKTEPDGDELQAGKTESASVTSTVTTAPVSTVTTAETTKTTTTTKKSVTTTKSVKTTTEKTKKKSSTKKSSTNAEVNAETPEYNDNGEDNNDYQQPENNGGQTQQQSQNTSASQKTEKPKTTTEKKTEKPKPKPTEAPEPEPQGLSQADISEINGYIKQVAQSYGIGTECPDCNYEGAVILSGYVDPWNGYSWNTPIDTERLKDKSRIKQAVDSYINVIYNEWMNDGMITKDDLKKYAFLYVYWEDTGDGYYDLYLMW